MLTRCLILGLLACAVACTSTVVGDAPDGNGGSGGSGGSTGDAGSGSTGGDSAAGGGTGGGGAGGGSTGGSEPACGGHGTPAEIAATPRADENLEMLAVSVSDGVTANQEIYDRIVRDVTAIRALEPSVAHISYRPPDDHQTVLLKFDEPTFLAIQNGTYHDWDCLNNHYVVESIDFIVQIQWVDVTLKGIYDMSIVASDYATLDNIIYAERNSIFGDGPTICLDASGDTWLWVFDDASGDCPAGCTLTILSHFTSEPNGDVAFVGSWSNYDSIPDPWPEWASICDF